MICSHYVFHIGLGLPVASPVLTSNPIIEVWSKYNVRFIVLTHFDYLLVCFDILKCLFDIDVSYHMARGNIEIFDILVLTFKFLIHHFAEFSHLASRSRKIFIETFIETLTIFCSEKKIPWNFTLLPTCQNFRKQFFSCLSRIS